MSGIALNTVGRVALNCLIVTAVKLLAAEAAAGRRAASASSSDRWLRMAQAIETDQPQTLYHADKMANCGIALVAQWCEVR